MKKIDHTEQLDAIAKHAKDNMEKYGWYCHLVPGNCHTHGFNDGNGNLENMAPPYNQQLTNLETEILFEAQK